jgi:carbonic anhydrase
VNRELEYMEFAYKPSRVQMVNNGHWVTWNYEQTTDSLMTTNGIEWKLQEVRFHSPSEHQVRGMRFPMEIQLIHESTDSFNSSYK